MRRTGVRRTGVRRTGVRRTGVRRKSPGDEAIQKFAFQLPLDCFASLAMTEIRDQNGYC
jgi:hypothetical protein